MLSYFYKYQQMQLIAYFRPFELNWDVLLHILVYHNIWAIEAFHPIRFFIIYLCLIFCLKVQ